MGELCLKEGIFILIFSLVLIRSSAQRDYFVLNAENLTWYAARNYCQVHFKELVTVTPENIKTIAKNLSSDIWIGLRRDVFWSRWADGEGLLFQNWYPGFPVLQKRNCPTAAATTTTTTGSNRFTSPNMTNLGALTNVTYPAVTSSSVPAVTGGAEDAGGYVEDSCVAMLSFGVWVERSCSERLSFVCYEDRFPGRVDVGELTSESAVLTWLPFPGNIDYYRVEVGGVLNQTLNGTLRLDLANLMAGTLHAVRVFPVKSGREKPPQQTAFYTKPNKVEHLLVVRVSETSVALNWSKPAGRVETYRVKTNSVMDWLTTTESYEVTGLTPGALYTFSVLSGVNGSSVWSAESNVTEYTRPGKVSNLKATGNTYDSFKLEWTKPDGNVTRYRVTATNAADSSLLFNQTVPQTAVNVTSLPSGIRVNFTVTALTDQNPLEGNGVSGVSYTTPVPVSNLSVTTTHNNLIATWSRSNGENFTVELLLDGKSVDIKTTNKTTVGFDNLIAAANYTVSVSVKAGDLTSPPTEASNFTGLVPPTDARLKFFDKDNLTFEWSAPANIAKVNYTVRLNSTFWGYDVSAVESSTSHTFSGLHSGTKYDFEVYIAANNQKSEAATASIYTVAVKREISLSMMCSSAQSLLCDQADTRENVFSELETHFRNLLGESVFWELEKEPATKGNP